MTTPQLFPNTALHQLEDGHHLRYAIVEPSGPVRGTFLVANGRREFIEKKAHEVRSKLVGDGYRIVFSEWRGQGYSSRFLSGAQRQRDHITDFNIYLNDHHSFYQARVQPFEATGPVYGIAHSMGGQLMLRAAAEHKDMRLAGLMMTAPMVALSSPWVEYITRKFLALQIKRGHGTDYLPFSGDYGPADKRFEKNPLSQDRSNFEIIERFFDAYPDMAVGYPTIAWLNAALISMRLARQPDYMRQITTPTLIIAGSKDQVIPLSQLRAYARRLPNAQFKVIEGSRHDILNEAERYRDQAWAHIEGFLEQPRPSQTPMSPRAHPMPA